MNVRVIMAMVKLRLIRVLRDRGGLVWLLVMPMVFSYIMGMLMGDWSGSGQPSRWRFLVYGGGAAVERLLEPVAAHERFVVVTVDSTLTDAGARALIDDGKATAVLLVPGGFAIEGTFDPTETLRLFIDSGRVSGQTARTLLDRAVLRANTEAAARSLVAAEGGPVSRSGAASFNAAEFDAGWQTPRVRLAVETLGRLETEDWGLNRAAQHVGPAYILFFMLMFMMVTASDLVTERQDRTLARLAVSRAGTFDLVAGFFLGGMVIGLCQGAILLGMNALLFKLDYGDSTVGLVLVMILFAGFASAASILLGTLARTGGQADGLGSGLTMTMAALGGLWWPLEVVPPFMQVLGRSLPTGQAISAFHGMIGRGWGIAELAPSLVGLALWFVGTLALAVHRLRRQIAS